MYGREAAFRFFDSPGMPWELNFAPWVSLGRSQVALGRFVRIPRGSLGVPKRFWWVPGGTWKSQGSSQGALRGPWPVPRALLESHGRSEGCPRRRL